MAKLSDTLPAHRDEILALAARYGIASVKVFGSVARGDDTEESDLDLLIDLTDEIRSGFDFLRFQDAVEHLVSRKVDILFERGIFPPMRPIIERDARSI